MIAGAGLGASAGASCARPVGLCLAEFRAGEPGFCAAHSGVTRYRTPSRTPMNLSPSFPRRRGWDNPAAQATGARKVRQGGSRAPSYRGLTPIHHHELAFTRRCRVGEVAAVRAEARGEPGDPAGLTNFLTGERSRWEPHSKRKRRRRGRQTEALRCRPPRMPTYPPSALATHASRRPSALKVGLGV